MSATSAMLKASFRMLREHKRLLVFPALSITAEAVVIASFAVPYVLAKHGSADAAAQLTTTSYVLLVLCGLVASIVSFFFNAALFLATAAAMNHEEVSIKAALHGAVRRLPTICAWAVVATVVSLILRQIDRWVPITGLVFGIAWSCVSWLALPVMIFEDAGVWKGTRRSVTVFKRTWREQTVGTIRLAGLGALLAVPALVILVLGIGTASGPAIIASIAFCLLWFGLCALVVSCLTGIYRVALFRYATTGTTPEQFGGLDLSRAFR
jgi:hypothetical protein